MKAVLKKFAVLGYTTEKLECFFKVQTKRTWCKMTPYSYKEEHIDKCFLFLSLSVSANSSDN
jgi:hypothetical protein